MEESYIYSNPRQGFLSSFNIWKSAPCFRFEYQWGWGWWEGDSTCGSNFDPGLGDRVRGIAAAAYSLCSLPPFIFPLHFWLRLMPYSYKGRKHKTCCLWPHLSLEMVADLARGLGLDLGLKLLSSQQLLHDWAAGSMFSMLPVPSQKGQQIESEL